MEDYNSIVDLIAKNRDRINFADYGQGSSDSWIKKAQERLNVNFPPSYIWWLKNYRGGEILGDEIFSIYEMDFDKVVGGDIVYMNELNRRNGSSSLSQLVIQENDFEEIYFFDLAQVDKNGESPIYDELTGLKYADDFLSFLRKKIEGK